jgi:hypothetical protein
MPASSLFRPLAVEIGETRKSFGQRQAWSRSFRRKYRNISLGRTDAEACRIRLTRGMQ